MGKQLLSHKKGHKREHWSIKEKAVLKLHRETAVPRWASTQYLEYKD